MRFEDACGSAVELRLDGRDGRYTAVIGDRRLAATAHRPDPDHLHLSLGDAEHQATVLTDGDRCFVGLESEGHELRRVPLFRSEGDRGEEDRHPVAPMPGRVVAVHAAEGDAVEAGQPLLVLEGMKMEYTLTAPVAGVVTRIYFRVGESVEADTPLVDIEDEGGAA